MNNLSPEEMLLAAIFGNAEVEIDTSRSREACAAREFAARVRANEAFMAKGYTDVRPAIRNNYCACVAVDPQGRPVAITNYGALKASVILPGEKYYPVSDA